MLETWERLLSFKVMYPVGQIYFYFHFFMALSELNTFSVLFI